ncbi:hypothetical protein P9209_03415 [Prescottella defluvii]|nr:hypothetical protein P9209_03415 [Prescottella defluvii]
MTTPTLCRSDGCRYLTPYPSGHCPEHQKAPMRLQPGNHRPQITRSSNPRRPVVLTVAGLRFTLSPADARRLADQLVDATETPCPKSGEGPDS